ncbi:uncharacterized protein LOC129773646 [Toxorhynchites rutilus septentrionalis]|uniref:uncharacterized protein LOC129773646 n=1 Tax=Toxorhynchites rutilus septentrionalis TaxID=329112 RepID=UPI00247A350E|nr:uncharacterized protein LOC129773646 [Toxorhynchites rutilus septentrionalis]
MSINMATPSISSGVTAATSPLSDLKLPRMNMPVFSGNYLEWQSFFDLFDSLTNLAGEAASLISPLKIEDANYQPALQKLKARYDKPREIANQHIKRFLAQPTLTSSSAHGLRSLHDVSDEVIRALNAMYREDRNTWLLFILSEKVDQDTKQLWCQKIAEMEEAEITLECFLKFVESRSFALQSAQPAKPKTSVSFKEPSKPHPQSRGGTAFVATNPPYCNVCSKQNHHLYQCGKFLHMSHNERLSHVNRKKLCNNCLKVHPGESCKSGTCRKCGLPHHTLLHPASSSASPPSFPTYSVTAQANPGTSAQSLISALDSPSCLDTSYVLLATVAINVLDVHGRPHACRAVLDCASQVSFISDSFCKQLGLKTIAADMDLEGISSTLAHADKCAEIIISSRCSDYRTSVSCVVLEKITRMLPGKPANIDDWSMPGSIHLADPLFHRPGKVEVLLGVELFSQLLEPGKIAISADGSLSTLQNTKLGWVVAGRYQEPNTSRGSQVSTCLLASTEDDLSQQLRKFWELEEYAVASKHLTEEEQRCEQHFAEYTYRNESGKFVVRLPFLHDPNQLGESRQIAEKRFHHIERKLDRNPQLKNEYHAFMREYIDLGHMSLVDDTSTSNKSVYLPHHCVVKTTSSTTKYRVVVDASAKTTSGLSLNDVLMCGPVIQDSLVNILIRFRFPPIVLAGDVKQMYRMVWLNELDRDFLKVLWRWTKDETLREYRLNTVTFGTKSASYLPTKCIDQLLDSYQQIYPVAVGKAKKGIYVDDVLTGAESEEEAKEVREQLTEIFAAGGFHLRKWASNSEAVLEGVPEADLEVKILIEEVMQRMWELKVAWDATPPDSPKSDQPVILARLISNVRTAVFPTDFYEIRAFSDSKVVLAWLTGGAARWKTFVANRVAEISTHVPSINWCHIGTFLNPADLISRGTFPDQLQVNPLWWHGPAWEPSYMDSESSTITDDLDTDEQRQIEREQRVTAMTCIAVYENRFMDEMIKRFYPNLKLLLPTIAFLDENGVARVGGRLQQSDFSYDNKHPILLPRHSILTSLILLHEHQEHLHCGPQSLLAACRTRFWILRGISAARKVCRDCVICSRALPARITQQMGQYPVDRLKPFPPFTITGVDYAGPVNLVRRRRRGAVPSKGYIALLVCFGTRAVHLEAVSDLSASDFLAAFTRFTSRYEVPSKMYSDNATNLRAAAKKLRELYQQIDFVKHSDEVNDFLTNKRIQWLFIPARSPHHGGLWEAGIKVAKGFLSKTGGNYIYTFEELSTLLAQVAACMNSRPICALSNNSSDPQPLIPAHFLIGRPLDALPEVNHLEQQMSALSRWNYVQRLAQEFRARWQSEYVLSLQRMVKWQASSHNDAVGDFVLLVDDHEKPQQWPLGRILEIFPGSDGLVRVVSIKTGNNTFRRDVRKLRRIPLDSDEYLPGQNGSEIPTRNLVGGLCSHQNERRYPTRSSSRRNGLCPPIK